MSLRPMFSLQKTSMKRTLTVAVTMAALFSAAHASAQTLRFAHVDPDDWTTSKKGAAGQVFKNLVEAETDLTVELYPAGSLGGETELIEGAQDGTISIAMVSGAYANFCPAVAVTDIPYTFPSAPVAWEVMDGEVGDELKRLSEEKGLVLLALWDNGIRHVSNNIRPIETPDDLEGLKIRTPPDEMTVDIFEALGSNPTPMNFSELYIALEQGVVDGQENPLMNIYSSKLHEVQDYISLTGHKYESTPLLMSKMVWDSLSPEYQEVIQQAAVEAGEFNRQASLEADEALRRDMEEAGVAFNEVDPAPFIEATSSVYDQWAEEYPELVDMVVKAAQRESQ